MNKLVFLALLGTLAVASALTGCFDYNGNDTPCTCRSNLTRTVDPVRLIDIDKNRTAQSDTFESGITPAGELFVGFWLDDKYIVDNATYNPTIAFKNNLANTNTIVCRWKKDGSGAYLGATATALAEYSAGSGANYPNGCAQYNRLGAKLPLTAALRDCGFSTSTGNAGSGGKTYTNFEARLTVPPLKSAVSSPTVLVPT